MGKTNFLYFHSKNVTKIVTYTERKWKRIIEKLSNPPYIEVKKRFEDTLIHEKPISYTHHIEIIYPIGNARGQSTKGSVLSN